MNIEEIAIRLSQQISPDGWLCGSDPVIEYTHALLAELSKDEPVYQFRPDCENWIDCLDIFYEGWKGEKRTLFTNPAPANTAEIESLHAKVKELDAQFRSQGTFYELLLSDEQNKVKVLTDALERHGRHDRDCAVNNNRFGGLKCDCGLDAALATVRGK